MFMKYDFTLKDVVAENKENPRTFMIPDQDEIKELEEGDLVKLIFLMDEPTEDGCSAERMWVNITEHKGEDFKGKLDNTPFFIKSLKEGDEICFKAENIATIYGGEAEFDEEKIAFISNRALEKRQINYVCKSDSIDSDEDSGWQLFYGDEDDDYCNDSDHISLIRLVDVLNFEPLLEDVFASDWEQFEYSEEENRFIEVE